MTNIITNKITDKITDNITPKITECTFCKNDNLIEDNFTIICKECGLVLNNDLNISSYTFTEEVQANKSSGSFSKLTKMQKWLEWTNEEKQIYKLKNDTRLLCETLNINETLIPTICDFVCNVMCKIKQMEGSKRSRVKDGIVIICICYISNNPIYNNTTFNYNSVKLAKKIGLDIKYITKADKIFLEIINCDLDNLLHIDKLVVNKQDSPMNYIYKIIETYNLNINPDIINKTKNLINICEDNDLLTDHTSLSIGVSCFYYILNMYNIEINIKLFTKMFDITNITINKINNKLKIHDTKIQKLLV
jgi:transcription initiation factor TFIIIB Brf1 subunit/transcription initiation factor TFIIB